MKNLIIKKRRNGSKIQAGQTSRKSVPDIGSYVLFFKVMFSAMIDMINATAEIAIEAHNKTITPRHLIFAHKKHIMVIEYGERNYSSPWFDGTSAYFFWAEVLFSFLAGYSLL